MRSIAQSLPHRLPAPTCAWIILDPCKYCSLHQRDAEPIPGSGVYVQQFLQYLCLNSCLQQVSGHVCNSCKALTHLCRRSHRAMKFAFQYAKGDYLVRRVKKIARSGKYSFTTQSGTRFSLLSKDVPFQLLAEFASKQQPNVARECPVRPRVGEHVQFTAGT